MILIGNEIIINHQTGYLIPPFEIEILADCIIKCLANEHDSLKIGTAGLEHLKLAFTFDEMILKTLCFYSKFKS